MMLKPKGRHIEHSDAKPQIIAREAVAAGEILHFLAREGIVIDPEDAGTELPMEGQSDALHALAPDAGDEFARSGAHTRIELDLFAGPRMSPPIGTDRLAFDAGED